MPALRGGIGLRILTKDGTSPKAMSDLSEALTTARLRFETGTFDDAGTISPEELSPAPMLYIGAK